MSNRTPLLSPSQEYLRLGIIEPQLLSVWVTADQYNRRFGPRDWDQVWYGFGRHPFGFKGRVIKLVGWSAKSDSPEIRTSEAYSCVYNELVRVLQRSKRVTAGVPHWAPPSLGPVSLADDKAWERYKASHGYDLDALARQLEAEVR